MSDQLDYSVRLLDVHDVAAVKELLRVFGDAFDDVVTYQQSVPSDDYLAALLGKEHFIAVAAFIKNTVVGGLTAYQLDKFEQNRREIYIYDLAVAEPHRRRGIARRLIQDLQRVAGERRAHVIFVQADLVDGPAIALYRSLGKMETVLHFDIQPLPAARPIA
jgi:ribosomal protein S18 acetylase RimI-like enzyme